MRIDPVVALTLMLFSIIVAATSISVSWGYALGRSALKGVTQPDVRPSATVVPKQADTADGISHPADADMVFWSEAEILADVKARTGHQATSDDPAATPQQ